MLDTLLDTQPDLDRLTLSVPSKRYRMESAFPLIYLEGFVSNP